MRRNCSFIKILVFIALCTTGCDLWVLGSERTGYRLIIESEAIIYRNVLEIETLLLGEGYQFLEYRDSNGTITKWRERPVKWKEGHKNEVYTCFEKKITISDKQDIINVYLYYIKNSEANSVQNVIFRVENWWRGGILPELRKEINHTGQLISGYLSDQLGEGKVSVKREGKNI